MILIVNLYDQNIAFCEENCTHRRQESIIYQYVDFSAVESQHVDSVEQWWRGEACLYNCREMGPTDSVITMVVVRVTTDPAGVYPTLTLQGEHRP
jgi:hypothetical protein